MLLYKRQVYYSAQDMLNLLQQLGKDSLDVATIVSLGNAQAAQVGLDSYDESRGIYTNVSPLLPTPPVQGPSGPAPTPEGTIVKTVANSPAFTDESLEQPLSLSGAVVEGDFLFNPDILNGIRFKVTKVLTAPDEDVTVAKVKFLESRFTNEDEGSINFTLGDGSVFVVNSTEAKNPLS